MARRSREPSVELRRHQRVDGSSVELWSVRYFDTAGRRRRRSCASRQEADVERARMALEATRPSAAAEADGATVLGTFWPVCLADARSRLEASTIRGHERTWTTRLEPHFGDFELRAIRPRMVAEWRAELLAEGVGAESVRRAMGLLQAVFTVALEWGEASDNPVKVVRKPRSGRRRVVTPLAPDDVERIRALMLDRGDTRSATLVSVLAYAGLRPGEALGLEVRHVRERTLLVEQAAAHGRLKLQNTGRAYRTVDLFGVLRTDLQQWIATVAGDAPGWLIFGRPDGGRSASTTGTTGVTVISTRSRVPSASASRAPTTCGTRSRHC
jgi:integrase